MKFGLKKILKKGAFFNATDLMGVVISHEDYNLVHYPLLDYWLDIGRPQDFFKAQEDIKHINLL